MTRTAIVVFCGLPGAGKSTLVCRLMEAAVRSSVRIHLFDYDQLHVDSPLDRQVCSIMSLYDKSSCYNGFKLYVTKVGMPALISDGRRASFLLHEQCQKDPSPPATAV